MDLVRLFIKRISYNQSQNDAFVLIMHEVETDLKLPIVIGTFEAQSIALELEKSLVPPRPLTHDLFKIFADTFSIQIKRVVIYKLEEAFSTPISSVYKMVKNTPSKLVPAMPSPLPCVATHPSTPIEISFKEPAFISLCSTMSPPIP